MTSSVAMASDKALFRYQMMWTRVCLSHSLSLHYSSTPSSPWFHCQVLCPQDPQKDQNIPEIYDLVFSSTIKISHCSKSRD